jgi:hypothetical protein
MADIDPQEKGKDEYRHLPDFLKYYANNVRFARTAWDLTMTFGELAGTKPGGGGIVEQKASVRLSWGQAKVMAIFLAINVAEHEAELGNEMIPSFVFSDDLKHLGDKDMSLEDMYAEIMAALNAQTIQSTT